MQAGENGPDAAQVQEVSVIVTNSSWHPGRAPCARHCAKLFTWLSVLTNNLVLAGTVVTPILQREN